MKALKKSESFRISSVHELSSAFGFDLAHSKVFFVFFA